MDSKDNDHINSERRRFLIVATSAIGVAGATGAALPFINSWYPSAKARAAGAPVRVNIAKLEKGQQIVVEWRGKPVFLVNRTAEMLKNIRKQDVRVSDPNSRVVQQPTYCQNEFRSRREELFLVIGICTHLGCSPKYLPEVKAMDFDAQWLGGYHCPCHGSMFDMAGRVYKGVPAPTNLEIPPYYFETDEIVVIGEDNHG